MIAKGTVLETVLAITEVPSNEIHSNQTLLPEKNA